MRRRLYTLLSLAVGAVIALSGCAETQTSTLTQNTPKRASNQTTRDKNVVHVDMTVPEKISYYPSAWDSKEYKEQHTGDGCVVMGPTMPTRAVNPRESDIENYTNRSLGAIKVRFSGLKPDNTPKWSVYGITLERPIVPQSCPNGLIQSFMDNSNSLVVGYLLPGTYEIQLTKDNKLILQPKIVNVFPHKVSSVTW